MKKLFFSWGIWILAVQVCIVAAPAEGASGSPNFLTLQSSVRYQGMGNASVAAVQDVNSLFSNPAGLGFADRYELIAMHRRGLEDIQHLDFGLVYSLGGITTSNVANLGSIGFGWGELDYGNLEGRDRSGVRVSDFTAEEKVLSLAYGQQFIKGLSIGVKGKRYDRTIDNIGAEGTAFDVGAILKSGRKTWSVGAMASNLGGTFKFAEKQEDLPQSMIYGWSYSSQSAAFTLSADVEDSQESELFYRGGAELWVNSIYALRAGYDSRMESGLGLTVGLGLALRDVEIRFFPVEQIALDYAFAPGGDLEDIHRIALSFRLGLP